MQAASLRLLGVFLSLAVRSVLVLLVSVAPIWGAEQAGVAESADVIGLLSRWDVILGSTIAICAVIAGVRADEEGSRSKERYFSPRNSRNTWEVADQPPEFWNQYKTDFAPGTHLRIHPLLDWTELNIWEYIEREKIPTVSLYYNQGDGKRYRSLGCYPCTNPVQSDARTVREIIDELRTGKFANIAECSGHAQDSEDEGGLESLRRDGYM